MNKLLVAYVLGTLCILSAAAMAPSLLIALFGEATPETGTRMTLVFLAVMAASATFGFTVRLLTRSHRNDRVTPSEGFAVATFGWGLTALFGALPYWLARSGAPGAADGLGTSPGTNLGFVEALFESMSGFTTTGATVFGTPLSEGGFGLIESLPRSLLFWRSMTHWLGGMGIVVLVLAVLPALRAGGYQLFQAEVPGPTAERLRPRIRATAAILWGVYLFLSAAEALLLWLGGMDVFDSVCHTFGTMATGGFSTKDASIGHYAMTGHPSALYFETVICVFMFLAGCNFLLHYRALHGRPLSYWRNAEFRQYVGVLAVAVAALTVLTRFGVFSSIGEALRSSVFHALAITTTTGYATADLNVWPAAAGMLLLILMFFGGCAGSTGGGLKQLRLMVVAKYFYRELMKLLRPHLVNRIWVGDVTLEERTCANIVGLVLLWLSVFVFATVAVLVVLSFQGRSDGQILTSLSAVAATLNNIGPGLGDVGSAANYGWVPGPAKVILLLCMLMGRLEVYSVIVVLLPVAWRK